MKNNLVSIHTIAGQEMAGTRIAPTVYFSLEKKELLEGTDIAQEFEALGFDIYATGQTAHHFNMNMVAASTAYGGSYTCVVCTGKELPVHGQHTCTSLEQAKQLLESVKAGKKTA
ncbi:MAG: hypothetical protein ACOX7F_03355 [Eubacteriales bacterium]|jgi:hypothetical protein